MKIKSNAKINLSLKILGTLPNGFHSLESLFFPIDMHDDIQFTPAPSLAFSSNCPSLDASNNSIIRAVHLFAETTNLPTNYHIHLTKRIPLGGGLGGGSSNAANTLLALNQLTHSNLPIEKLHQLAQTLGADVPFFLYNQPSIVTGYGEQITPLPPNTPSTPHHLTILTPSIHCCTKTVFETFDKIKAPVETNESSLFSNNLQPAAFTAYPALRSFFDWVCAHWHGEIPPFLTGSGSSIVLISTEASRWQPSETPPCPYETHSTIANIPNLS